ncbi:hypothetical protein [Marimonas lutisalis]|uniref:hypothetical protein n=1 Tax=Marimonas lutisalis TaxID=2545756 RepID=UPI0010F4598F|nr:hypothetical protein [Marimonas lutisalis]
MSVLLVTACADTGPVYPTSDTLDPWVIAPDSVTPGSDRAPHVAGERMIFRLAPGERRSSLSTGRDWGVWQNYLMGFDVRVAPGQAPAQPVTLARFLRRGDPETELVAVMLDARRGITVLGRSCVPAARLGDWHSVELRIRLADNDTGFLEIFCDRRPIWAQDGFRTTLPPTCRHGEGCATPVPRPARFEWQVGLVSPGRVARAIRVEMQRIFHHRLFVIPNRVGTL